MEKKEFEKLKNQAHKAISNLKSKEDDLLMFFQPYFYEEISVLYQESDGFMVLHDVDNSDKYQQNKNSGISEVFQNIQKDENYYKAQSLTN